MSLTDRVRGLFGRPRKRPPRGFPMVLPRISRDAGQHSVGDLGELYSLPASFPFELYDIIDNVAILDPYVSKYVHTTVSLSNVTHKLYIRASDERRATEAIDACNQFAARCYPLGGGLDGVVSAMLSQLARTGALCVEWTPDRAFTRIERVFLVPVKTLRFRHRNAQGEIELTQQQDGELVALNPVQTSYHGLIFRDSNPYPIPPIISALEACATHREIMGQIRVWMSKISSLGVMLAEVQPPPREPGETQSSYDSKSGRYLQRIADTVVNNLNNGLGIGFSNIKFTFQSTQSGAQGAKDILQLVLQGMFSALQRDPIFFGWSFHSSDSLASVVYEEMFKSLKIYQLGVKRSLEHGHRLNLAFNGMSDVGVSVQFRDDEGGDVFKVSEAKMMMAQAVISQMESGLISREEARRLLGHEDKSIDSGAYVAAFNRRSNSYGMEPFIPRMWSGANL